MSEVDMVKVDWSEVAGNVEITGKLGRPLGQLVDIQGEWIKPDPSKPAQGLWLLVNKVGGVEVKDRIVWSCFKNSDAYRVIAGCEAIDTKCFLDAQASAVGATDHTVAAVENFQ